MSKKQSVCTVEKHLSSLSGFAKLNTGRTLNEASIGSFDCWVNATFAAGMSTLLLRKFSYKASTHGFVLSQSLNAFTLNSTGSLVYPAIHMPSIWVEMNERTYVFLVMISDFRIIVLWAEFIVVRKWIRVKCYPRWPYCNAALWATLKILYLKFKKEKKRRFKTANINIHVIKILMTFKRWTLIISPILHIAWNGFDIPASTKTLHFSRSVNLHVLSTSVMVDTVLLPFFIAFGSDI